MGIGWDTDPDLAGAVNERTGCSALQSDARIQVNRRVRLRLTAVVWLALATSLETALERAEAANPNPGGPLLHRLNRAECANVVRDVQSFDVDTSADARVRLSRGHRGPAAELSGSSK